MMKIVVVVKLISESKSSSKKTNKRIVQHTGCCCSVIKLFWLFDYSSRLTLLAEDKVRICGFEMCKMRMLLRRKIRILPSAGILRNADYEMQKVVKG